MELIEYWKGEMVAHGDIHLKEHLQNRICDYFNLLVRTDIQKAKSIFSIVRTAPDGTACFERWE